ncbi:membrane lipoprotein lipid attachment site-containing protein [Domibacillus robiginosus]|uniref:membrane lipoprotein lipid attachment site-containing protein n=1 Tax=Domibacillus robiginosus TaxID=1071054 RepID=UPI00067BC206|nr:membrane lipoprotein lipid attachment site-containing protein [Domibacillus robiginosus]
MKKVIVALFLTTILSACGNAGVHQVDLDTVDSLVGGKEDGFLFMVYENDEGFMPYVEDAAEKTKAEINFYNVSQPDGEGGAVGENVFEGKVENDLKRGHLYYLENGEPSESVDLSRYGDGLDLSSEIQNFIEIHQ